MSFQRAHFPNLVTRQCNQELDSTRTSGDSYTRDLLKYSLVGLFCKCIYLKIRSCKGFIPVLRQKTAIIRISFSSTTNTISQDWLKHKYHIKEDIFLTHLLWWSFMPFFLMRWDVNREKQRIKKLAKCGNTTSTINSKNHQSQLCLFMHDMSFFLTVLLALLHTIN